MTISMRSRWGSEPFAGYMGFGFAGGKGTVDNVRIRGKLDMDWS